MGEQKLDVTLRELGPDDIEEFWALIERERSWLAQWLRWPAGITKEIALETLKAAKLGRDEGKGLPETGICVNGELVGAVGHVAFNPRHLWCALGYWVAEPYSGRGVVTEATRQMIEISFERFGMHRIEILCRPTNIASRRVAEKLGFVEEGTPPY
ncbi:MAG: GNAT family N-acetyltransferase [Planctomycetes bacterium]|nr:GNAT family N-acetyltransferase [Planctomycetota bacterium]